MNERSFITTIAVYIMENIQQQLLQARRNLILDAAIEVIAEKGFQRTTIKEIAKKAEVADGTIYNYFKNKDALFMSIIDRLIEAEVDELAEAAEEQPKPSDFVGQFIQNRMDDVEQNLSVLKAILPETMSNSELGQSVYEQIYGPAFQIGEAYFRQLVENDEIESIDPVIAGRLFASVPMGIMLFRLMGDEHVAENWSAYSEAVSQFISQAFNLPK